tara:strand:- start:40 stop:546 length:507 start_codon:yes stop_codon:yes gene_type:complete
MTSLFNLVWFVFFGAVSAVLLLVLSLLMAITIIGWPIAKVLFNLAKLSAFPFGKEIVRESTLNGKDSVGTFRTVGGFIANILWLPLGLVLAVCYGILAIFAFITIIGIPIGIVYVRLAKFIVWPVGAKVVTATQAQASAVANELEKRGLVGSMNNTINNPQVQVTVNN